MSIRTLSFVILLCKITVAVLWGIFIVKKLDHRRSYDYLAAFPEFICLLNTTIEVIDLIVGRQANRWRWNLLLEEINIVISALIFLMNLFLLCFLIFELRSSESSTSYIVLFSMSTGASLLEVTCSMIRMCWRCRENSFSPTRNVYMAVTTGEVTIENRSTE